LLQEEKDSQRKGIIEAIKRGNIEQVIKLVEEGKIEVVIEYFFG
jgi:hypothetical protein